MKKRKKMKMRKKTSCYSNPKESSLRMMFSSTDLRKAQKWRKRNFKARLRNLDRFE